VIVFFGYGNDSSLSRAARAATDLGVRALFLDQLRPEAFDFSFAVANSGVSGWIACNGARCELAHVRGVYARPLVPPPQHDARLQARSIALCEIFSDWMDVAEARIVNRPSAMHSNSSKPFQGQIIAKHGFVVPDTLITSDPDEALTFWRMHGNVVFKSMSGIRSIVQRLDTTRARELHRVRSLPTQFQAYVPGVDVRVHVVGTRVFATEIESEAVDYRYASRDGLDATLRPIELPDEIGARCVNLSAALGLSLCGLDLRRTPSGRWVCFEVNPMPAFSYFESEGGQPVARAIVELLQ